MRKSRIAAIATLGTAAASALSACGGSGFSSSGSSGASGTASASANTTPLTILIGSSGTAETDAVKSAVSAWSQKSGIQATVVASSNLEQDAAKGFAAGKPADILYTSPADLATWAKAGNMYAYGDTLSNKSDFYAPLVKAFTYNNKFYCAPKDFSTLALEINTTMWQKAGLTNADIPTTWAQLDAVGQKIKAKGMVPLTFGPQIERVGVFMAQAGGQLVSADGKTATVNSAANIAGLTEVQKLLKDGTAAYSNTLHNAGWGGEAFGKQYAVMTIEGNWITGAMQTDYKNVKYKVVQLPAGVQKGTLEYTNCWGITAKSGNIGGAENLVEYLTSTQQQLAFAKAFGVMPSVQSAKAQWIKDNPSMAAFVDGASYAQNLPSMPGASAVITDFDQKLPSLATTSPKSILDAEQKNLQAAINNG